jgi:purine-binding chemotaxis protein CheW
MDATSAHNVAPAEANTPQGAPPTDTARWVVFKLDANRCALPLQAVERIVRAAEVTPLPLAPPVVLGAIDVGGQVLPVFNLRRRFRLPERPLDPADHFILAQTSHRTVALIIDHALGVIEQPTSAIVATTQIVPELAHIRGVIALSDGLLLIQDLEQFLSPDESAALDLALLSEAESHAG